MALIRQSSHFLLVGLLQARAPVILGICKKAKVTNDRPELLLKCQTTVQLGTITIRNFSPLLDRMHCTAGIWAMQESLQCTF